MFKQIIHPPNCKIINKTSGNMQIFENFKFILIAQKSGILNILNNAILFFIKLLRIIYNDCMFIQINCFRLNSFIRDCTLPARLIYNINIII